MCGILGVYNTEKSVSEGLEVLSSRGKDALGWFDEKSNEIVFVKDISSCNAQTGLGHALHAIVGHHPQPLQKKGVLVVNCEIYNWNVLAQKHNLQVKNDADLLLQLLDQSNILNKEEIFSLLDELDGVYAFLYERDNIIISARDLVGVKPLWYSHQDGFAASSEKKVLLAMGFSDISESNPRNVVVYTKKDNALTIWQRPFFTKQVIDEEKSLDEYAKSVKETFSEAILKRIPSKGIKVGVLFSGGVDSSLITKVLMDNGFDVTCYTAVVDNPDGQDPHDLIAAKSVAKKYGFSHKIVGIPKEELYDLAKDTAVLIEEANAVKVSVGMPFLAACRVAKEDGCRIIFSGLGAEELYAGYQRHKNSSDVNDECFAGLMWMYERDLYRDDVITMRNGLELRVPFLDKKLIEQSLTIPAKFKLKEEENKVVEKYILRKAALLLGLDEEDAFRPKKAAQYGSRFDSALARVAKKEGKKRAEFLQQFLPNANRKIGVMCSGGKDSWYAAYVMKKLNYQLACCLTMRSENEASYMFHTPAIDLVRLQCQSANIPLLEQETKGVKEEELEDLRLLLQKGKEEFGLDGIVTGALFSQYQRSRIEKLCNELNMKVYAPLWHLEQSSELQELLREGFSITMSAIAGDGVNKSWLGKPISEEEVDALLELKKKIGFNVAGEGGEYESLVLDCPLFSQKLVIEYESVMENEITGHIKVTSASLVEK